MKKLKLKQKLPMYLASAFVIIALVSLMFIVETAVTQPGKNKGNQTESIDSKFPQDVLGEEDKVVTPSETVTPVVTTLVPETLVPVTTVITTPKPTNPPAQVSAIPTVTVTTTPTLLPSPSPIITIDYSQPWPVAPNCPATTQNCVPCTKGTLYCRVEADKIYGFLGWSCQNNNPGNIRPDSSVVSSCSFPTYNRTCIIKANGGPASCGTRIDGEGRGSYMVFSDYSGGFSALKAYLKGISLGQHAAYLNISFYDATGTPIIQSCGECSLKAFFSKYAPAGDQNDPNSYANNVANKLGVNADTTMLSWITANKLDAFAEAIKAHEGWFTK